MIVLLVLFLLAVLLTELSRSGRVRSLWPLLVAMLPWVVWGAMFEATLIQDEEAVRNVGGDMVRRWLPRALAPLATFAARGSTFSVLALAHLAVALAPPADGRARALVWAVLCLCVASFGVVALGFGLPLAFQLASEVLPAFALLVVVAAVRRRVHGPATAEAAIVGRAAWLLAWLGGVYVAVMVHRVVVLSVPVVTPAEVDAALLVRGAVLALGLAGAALLALRVQSAKRALGAAPRLPRVAVGASSVLAVGALASALGHQDLMEGWLAYRPPWHGLQVQPPELPRDARRDNPSFPKWSGGAYHPYPAFADEPWALVLRRDGVSVPGSRDVVAFDHPSVAPAVREHNFSGGVPTVVDRDVPAQLLFAFAAAMDRRGVSIDSFRVYGPIEGSMPFAELRRKRVLLPWIAPVAVEHGFMSIELAWQGPMTEGWEWGHNYLLEERGTPGVFRFFYEQPPDEPEPPAGEGPALVRLHDGSLRELWRMDGFLWRSQLFVRPTHRLDVVEFGRYLSRIRETGFEPRVLMIADAPPSGGVGVDAGSGGAR